jgi:hypothetical protein
MQLTEEEQNLYNDYIDGSISKSYVKFDFADPIDLAYILCDTIIAETHTLHDWQKDTLLLIAKDKKWTKAEYLEFYLAACNGSGKDAYVIALLTVFLSLTIIRHRCVISTASAKQLKRQTIPYIQSLCAAANKKFQELGYIPEGENVFIIQQEHIVSPITGSEITMFVTDDPGKAEGFHPWPNCPTQELCIILNEAKSIPDLIFEHFRKCTYSRWIEVSSTGTTGRHFYSEFNAALDWNDYIKMDKESRSNQYRIRRRITAYDCPHISSKKIERAIEYHGRDSYYVKTTLLSEFASTDDLTVISREKLDACVGLNIKKQDLGIGRRAGLDLGGGRAKTVLTVLDENTIIAQRFFVSKDTIKTADWCIKMFKEYNLDANTIFGDDNGIGQAIIDEIARQGYNIRRVRNQFAAIDKTSFGNLGAELYHRAAAIVEHCLINLGPISTDEDFKLQLCDRRIERRGQYDKIFLQTKDALIEAGGESPDKADSFVLAFTGLSRRDFESISPQEKKTGQTPFNAKIYSSDYLASKAQIKSSPYFKGYKRTIRKGLKNIFITLDNIYGNKN